MLIPADRQKDVGAAYGVRSGIKRDMLRSLETHSYSVALTRRDRALTALREEVDGVLMAAGFAPLDTGWSPSRVRPGEVGREALDARDDILSQPALPDQEEIVQSGKRQVISRTSPRSRRLGDIADIITERAQAIEDSGGDGGAYFSTYHDIITGQATPIGPLFDKWVAGSMGHVKMTAINFYKSSLREFGRFLVETSDLKGVDPDEFVRRFPIEAVTKRRAGEFPEWLIQARNVGVPTALNRISPLRSFWSWLEIRGRVEMNPWLTAATSLKRFRDPLDKPVLREFTDDELTRILQWDIASEDTIYRQALFDAIRISLLTGARQNEICTLTRSRVQVTASDLMVIYVTHEEAKTKNSIRFIPIHPLVRPVLEARLAEADASDDASLFPECSTQGPDDRRSTGLSKSFTALRRTILGADSDDVVNFHSFRKCFVSNFERARAAGGAGCTDLVRDHLIGHTPSGTASQVYAAKNLGGSIYEEAIMSTTELGMSQRIRELLVETQKMRPERPRLPVKKKKARRTNPRA